MDADRHTHGQTDSFALISQGEVMERAEGHLMTECL